LTKRNTLDVATFHPTLSLISLNDPGRQKTPSNDKREHNGGKPEPNFHKLLEICNIYVNIATLCSPSITSPVPATAEWENKKKIPFSWLAKKKKRFFFFAPNLVWSHSRQHRIAVFIFFSALFSG
jgi:hypothetical protein